MVYCQNAMGIVIALLGTALVWISRVSGDSGAVWPALLATVGFWLLGALLVWLKRRR
ncbi:MAG: hypothetical protein MI724_16110 [Spirochaetales bacterium]|nr:hypothetical protein [Spirochaetales bacterium]